MKARRDYLDDARKKESIFRAILRDLKEHREKRLLGSLIPNDFDSALSLEIMFEKYSSEDRNGKFTILDFRSNREDAILSFQKIDYASGMGGEGVELRYK